MNPYSNCSFWHWGESTCQVYHCGPPNDIEMYVQEVGRGGLDGLRTVATLYYAKSLKRFVDKTMVQYAEDSTSCRRDKLFGDFNNITVLYVQTFKYQCWLQLL